MMSLKWHVVQPTWSGDALARAELEELFKGMGMDEETAAARVFMPTYKRFALIRYSKGRRREITLPLTAGYLFVRLSGTDEEASWVQRRPHVNRFLLFPGTVDRRLTLPQDAAGNCKGLDQLREACAAGKFDQGKTRSGSGYLKDDRVLITEGPLAGTVARFKDGRCKQGFGRLIIERLMASRPTRCSHC